MEMKWKRTWKMIGKLKENKDLRNINQVTIVPGF